MPCQKETSTSAGYSVSETPPKSPLLCLTKLYLIWFLVATTAFQYIIQYSAAFPSLPTHYGQELTENERDFLLLQSRLVSGCLDPSFSRQCKYKMSNFFLSERKGSLANSRKRQVNSSKVRLQALTEMWHESISVLFSVFKKIRWIVWDYFFKVYTSLVSRGLTRDFCIFSSLVLGTRNQRVNSHLKKLIT